MVIKVMMNTNQSFCDDFAEDDIILLNKGDMVVDNNVDEEKEVKNADEDEDEEEDEEEEEQEDEE